LDYAAAAAAATVTLGRRPAVPAPVAAAAFNKNLKAQAFDGHLE
jgi:hypothetical protein